MSEEQWESGEESIDEEGRNPTQRRIDDEGADERPVDTPEAWGETVDQPHQGEEDQDIV